MRSLALLTACLLALVAHAERLRPPAAAGSYYPEEPYALQQAVRKFVIEAPGFPPDGAIDCIIVPHAPYGLAGPVIAAGLKHLQPGQYDRVIVLGPSQAPDLAECSMPDCEAFITPLGLVPVDETAVNKLRYSPFIKTAKLDYRPRERGVHEDNTSIEVVLPFLQERIGVFRLVPVVVGNLMHGSGPEAAGRIGAVARSLREITDERTLVVATCNFTHYGSVYGYTPFSDDPEPKVKALDEDIFAMLLAQENDALAKELRRTQNMVSSESILQLVMLMLPESEKGSVVAYDTSGRRTGHWENSISFGALIFYDPSRQPPLIKVERKLNEITAPMQPLPTAPAPATPAPETAPLAPAPAPDAAEAN